MSPGKNWMFFCKEGSQKEAFVGFLTVLLGVAVTLFSYPCLDVFRLFDRLKSLANKEHRAETQAMCILISLCLLILLKKRPICFQSTSPPSSTKCHQLHYGLFANETVCVKLIPPRRKGKHWATVRWSEPLHLLKIAWWTALSNSRLSRNRKKKKKKKLFICF